MAKQFQYVPEYLEKLRSPAFADRFFTFRVIFHAPPAGKAALSSIRQYQGLENFRAAQELENNDFHFFNRIYGATAGTALQSHKKSKKSIDMLPYNRIRVPLVWPNRWQWIMSQCLDLQIMHELQAKVDASVEQFDLQCRTLLYDDGKSRTFGVLIRCPETLPTNANLQVGTTGHIKWLGRNDIPPWTIMIGNPPKQAASTDFYAIAWPPMIKNDGEKHIDTHLPNHIINVDAELRAGTFRNSVLVGQFDLVSLKICTPDKTEKQQFAALVKANPFTRGPEAEPQIASKVAPILMGHGLKELKEKSVFSDGFGEDILKDLSSLNCIFAHCIGIEGATVSEEQLKFALEYPSKAPSDGLMVAIGHAGSAKTTAALIFAILQWFDGRKKGIIVTEMNATADNTARSAQSFISKATEGLLCVREYGTEADLCSILYVLDGQPREYGARWTQGMETSDLAEMNDMLNLVSETVKKTNGHPSKKFSALQCTAVWKILDDMNLIESLDGQRRHEKMQEFQERAKVEAGDRPTDELEVDMRVLIAICKEMLEKGRTKKAKNTAINILNKVKTKWYAENVALIVTTISKLGEPMIRDFHPAWALLEEAQCVSDHNATIFLTTFPDIPKYLVSNPRQLASYCADGEQNPFAAVRKHSLMAKEVKRGRPHVVMKTSMRMGPLAAEKF